ncbi:MAG TPA: hypothetical protein VF746_10565 [Longimicrobium sp.]|jgi:glycosyltransferase involved in cell wall biosynthesis
MHPPELLTPPRRPLPPGRRLLLISHHFPPGQATGALRWQKLASHAAERGWGIDAITVHPDSLASADFTRLAELPEGTRVYGVRVPPDRWARWEDAAHAFLRRVVRRSASPGRSGSSGGSASPAHPAPADADLAWRRDLRWSATPAGALRAYRAWRSFAHEWAWAKEAADAAAAVLEAGVHAAVVTCGPPHMVHLAGRQAAARAGLPFVMDLRDPWSLAPAVTRALGSPLWYRLAERHERRAVADAALVVCNTGALADAMRAAHPAAAERVVAVMNGCDEEPLPPRREDGRFTIAYAGNIYIDRDPRPLLRAAARVAREEGLPPERFGLEFVGHADAFGGVPLVALAEAEGAGGYVTVHPRRPRAEALAMLAKASVLLSLPQGVDLAIPSKVFEYMQFPAWLLALAARGSATEVLLRGSGADVVEPGDEEAIARVLGDRYRRWARGERPRPLNADGRFGRRRQAEVLFAELERIAGESAAVRRGRAA